MIILSLITAAFVQPELNSFDDGYVKDRSGAYYKGKRINNIHAPTFVYLGNGYAKDRNRFYNLGRESPEL